MRLSKIAAALVIGASLGAGWVHAADNLAPQEQTKGSVSFVSGGVGEDDRQRMQQMRSQYPLELLFVTRGNPNQFLSDVKVQIAGGSNAVLDTVSNGPFLLVKLPPGRYTVTADSEGSVKRQAVQVAGGKTQRVMFVWPPVEEQPPK